MFLTIQFILFFFAFLCFLAVTFNVQTTKISLTGLGLALFTAAFLVGLWPNTH